MNRSLPSFQKYIHLIVFLLSLVACLSSAMGQTPGLILKPATGAGALVLDPNGDGYVSQKIGGVQVGFVSNDVSESEIPYSALVKPDPLGDILSGSTGGFTDIVGTDASGNNAILSYKSGTNLYFRFRLSAYAANSKSYSILIDTDQKFGFTGPNADPNALPGNAGYEAEIVLRSNFSIDVYDADGRISGLLLNSYPYDTYCQKSVALSRAGGDADYFYDFYLPIPSFITSSAGLRYIAVTGMSPSSAIGSNSASDVGGVGIVSNLDQAFTDIIEAQAPSLPGQEVLARSSCPTITGPISSVATSISGTTTEVPGTIINVSVYQSNAATLVGSGTVTTTGSGWSINVAALSPSVTLTTGYKVKATATAPGKGISYDNCDIETVSDCSVKTTSSGFLISSPNSGKGLRVTNSSGGTATITLYKSDYTLFSLAGITNPQVGIANGSQAIFECQTGNCFPNDVYYFTYQKSGECVSDFNSTCIYSPTGTATAPVITTTPITTGTTSISGTCGANASPGTVINLYADGVFLKATTAVNSTSWTINGLNLSAYSCKSITASAADIGKCPTNSISGVTVTRQAFAPVINYSGCALTAPTVVSGYSSEIGATVQLFNSANLTTPLGTAVVQVGGTWSVSTISPAIVAGNTIQAKIAAGGCITASAYSNLVTISTQTNISNYTLGITPPTEGQTAVGGTISGGTYPLVLKVYVDQVLVGGGINVNSAGSWTVSGLNSFDLAVGSKVQVTLTGPTGCESALSTSSVIVQCVPPTDKTISTTGSEVCANSYGTIIVQASQPGILYTPVASDGTTVAGYSGMGNGGNLNITTQALIVNPTLIKVKASRFPAGSCDLLMGGSGVSFQVNSLPAAPTAQSPQVYCSSGTAPTLADLQVTVPQGCKLNWYSLSAGGISLASTTALVNNTTYFAESENTTTGCRSNTRTAVLVQTGTPAAPAAPASQTFCSGATIANLTASLTGPGTIRWFAAPGGGSALGSGIPLVNGTSYYAETLQNSCLSSSRTAVTATVNPVPVITSTLPATRCGSGKVTLGATASAGTINWYDALTGGNLVGTGPSFTSPDITSTTTYFVDATSNGCITGGRTSVAATVNSIPTITVTNAPSCALDLLTYSITVTVSSGSVTSTAGTVVNNSGNIWTISGVPQGTDIVLTVNANGCINTLPVISPDCNCALVASPVSGGDKTYCSGSLIPAIAAIVSAGETIDWYALPTGGLSLFSGISYTPSSAGTYYAEARNISTNCKSSIRTPVTVTVNQVPVVNSMTTTTCTGAGFTVNPTNGIDGTVPSGTTYSWAAPSGSGFTGGQSGSGAANISGTLFNTTNTAQTAVYTVTPAYGSCTGSPFTVTVTIYPAASITSVTGTSPLAMGATATFTTNSAVLGGGTGVWSSSNTAIATVHPATGVVTGIAPGSCNIIYTISGGCAGTVSALKTVTVVPTVSFTAASQSSINESGSLSITLNLSAAGSQPVSVPFILSGTATGNGTDYTISASPIILPAGSTTATITISIANDGLVEGNEMIVLTMGTPTNAIQGGTTIYTATITDDDAYPVDDADGDGVINALDQDDDNDGIPDTVEGSADTDGDGVANWFDVDSDNDGIYDIMEAGGADGNFDGKVDNFTDGNGNGLIDQYDASCNNSTVNGQGNQITATSGTVVNPALAVDADATNAGRLNDNGASMDIKLAQVVPPGQVISLKLSSYQNNATTACSVQQSMDGINYSNAQFYTLSSTTPVTYSYPVAESNALYIRITNNSIEATNIYILTYSFPICNGVLGTALADYDSDGDGIKDRIEIDADNDGCRDVIEAGFTDANSDGKLDGTGVNTLGKVTGNINGYSLPVDAYLTSAYDFRESNPTAVGGTVSGGKTICAGNGSGTLTLGGYTGIIAKWQSAVSPFTSWTDMPGTSTTYSSGILTQTTHFRAVVITGACSSAVSASAIVLVRPTPTASISGSTSVCQNAASPNVTFTNPQDLPVTITYNINGLNATSVNVGANSSATVAVPTAISGTYVYNLVSVVYQTAPTCSNSISGTATIIVTAPPTSIAGTAIATCSNSGAVNITAGSSASNYTSVLWTSDGTGTFTNATSLTLATYTPSVADIAAGGTTLTLTAYGNSPCTNALSTKILQIGRDGLWTGAVDQDWNNTANWACNQLPTITTDVLIANGKPRYPILFSGSAGKTNNITIENNASVTIVSNTLEVAGAISNTGTFTALEGTIEMKGAAPQYLNANVFAGNTIMNLICNNAQGVTLQGPLNITGFLRPLAGDFNAAGYVTLLSTATQNALVDGTGSGNVTGTVNMQRYLPSSFGYKYFSSPFQSASVGGFATVVNLAETFPSFYKYDENNGILNQDGSTSYKSGWVKYTEIANPLVPMAGYAANLGANSSSLTVTLSGEVNNGPLSLALGNHNREFTKGFNLVGNPFPSPVDWNALGWTKNNIDNAIYFFNAGNTDRYAGVYSSYVNGISSDGGTASNIIAAMQGFFVHVTDGVYPVQATLGVSNAVRINHLNPVFKSAVIDNRPTLRLTAGFEINNAIRDAAVVYFDPMASVQFDKDKDALKLENTDELVPNIYTLADGHKLSINGLSEPSDSVSFIPLGITTYRDGWINFSAENANDLSFKQVYLADGLTGKYHDLRQSPDVRFSLQRGVCDNRFKLVFSKGHLNRQNTAVEKMFTLMRSDNQVLVKVNLPVGTNGNLLVTNLLGQTLIRKEVSGKEIVEVKQDISTGVYVITLVSGKITASEKILMRQDYE